MLRRKIGDFYLTEMLGKGGMSEVYLATHPRSGEKRAVKILHRRALASPSLYARFLREIGISRSLCHPNIVRIYENGVLPDAYYYSMEYCPGGILTRRLEGGQSSTEEILALFGGVCNAMAYAHERGVVHRDLKPSNVLLSADGQALVSDFGIAKVLRSQDTELTARAK
jgi:serine/threonine protein kinase